MNISIIGCGLYSLSIAKRLSKNTNNNITIWCEDLKKVDEFTKTSMIKSIYKTEKFNSNIKLTNDYHECLSDTDIIFMMTSMPFLEATLTEGKKYYKKNIPVIIGTKGIDVNTSKFPYYITRKLLKTNNLAILAGPSFAVDIINDEILALTVATKKKSIFKKINNLFNESNNAVLEYSKDIVGIQLSSTLKNIYAIGSGILEGLKLPESNRAIYFTKIFKEYDEILYMLSSDYRSILTLGCIGDTIMTCSDSKSRNYTYGTKLCAKSSKPSDTYLTKNTVEGYHSINTLYYLLNKKRIDAPIIKCIYNIVNKNINTDELKKELLK